MTKADKHYLPPKCTCLMEDGMAPCEACEPERVSAPTCSHPSFGDSPRCAEITCPNYYMKGTDGFWAPREDDQ